MRLFRRTPIDRVRVLDLHPGDIIVLEVGRPIKMDEADAEHRFPGHTVLVLNQITMSVTRAAAAADRPPVVLAPDLSLLDADYRP